MGDPGSTPAYYSAKPRIKLEGQLSADLTKGFLTLLVIETIEGLSCCELTFANWEQVNGGIDYLYFDRKVLDFGKKLAVRAGEGETEAQIFEGQITGIEGHYTQDVPPEILVLAEDRFQELRMTRRTRTFEDASDSDVIRRIASQHSLDTDIDVDDGPAYKLLAQVNQSDLAFIRERVRAIDAEVWVEDNILHAKARSRRSAGRLTLTYRHGGLREFSVLADLANQRSTLTVSGWDVSAKEGIRFEASESAITGELNGNRGGSSVLQSAFGKRAEQMVHMVPLTTQEAKSLAEAHYRKMARRFVTGYGIADGDGRIRAGTHLELKNLGKMFDGEYYVTETRHIIDKNGYRTHFAVERSGIG